MQERVARDLPHCQLQKSAAKSNDRRYSPVALTQGEVAQKEMAGRVVCAVREMVPALPPAHRAPAGPVASRETCGCVEAGKRGQRV
jgi:hypothetical protein